MRMLKKPIVVEKIKAPESIPAKPMRARNTVLLRLDADLIDWLDSTALAQSKANDGEFVSRHRLIVSILQDAKKRGLPIELKISRRRK